MADKDLSGAAEAFASLGTVGPRSTVPIERLARLFVEVVDTLVDDFDVIEFSQMLTRRVAGLFGSGQVGLMLTDHGDRLAFTAASGDDARALQLVQLQHEDGPCLDAFGNAQPVICLNLAEAQGRWPHFAPRASRAGFTSVHALPLRLREQAIGVLSLFGVVTELNDTDMTILQSLADAAAIGLLQQRAFHQLQVLSEQLQTALTSRIIIEQAKGIMAQARGVGPEEAFVLIRRYARTNNQRLIDVANSIVAGPVRSDLM